MPSWGIIDALEEPHDMLKDWRKSPAAASHLGDQTSIKAPRVRIPLPSAPFWARKPKPLSPVRQKVKLQRAPLLRCRELARATTAGRELL
jgi:hypothetical protein